MQYMQMTMHIKYYRLAGNVNKLRNAFSKWRYLVENYEPVVRLLGDMTAILVQVGFQGRKLHFLENVNSEI